ncbi:PHP domain-containing protein [Clostridium botulinum]|uniref:CehA/McbA family metallohydrolase n=1 Tax=Clostridium botulinum TaxID=1491 RepID=UPI0006A702A1|nr:CehA/McbA family metallohydrolase [Clostridium botulinum]KAI3350205.1 CehA/McbA family metallohydrolase [Clostridium botulinum]KOM89013.1 DNA-binding protein [Clostridium botulinum]KOR63578.1 DNA-binding protein [Clostridium botulinum]MBN1075795.1 PHP domain-containing protein [Clostridium botulinum]MBN1079064.1 PHP domain-containing protein [Clostridium botulinum]
MLKKNKRLLALLVSVSVLTTSVVLPSERIFAALGGIMDSNLSENSETKSTESTVNEEKADEKLSEDKIDVNKDGVSEEIADKDKGESLDGDINKDKEDTSKESQDKVEDKSEGDSKNEPSSDKNVSDNIEGDKVENSDKENNEKDKEIIDNDKEVVDKDKENEDVIEDSKEATDVISIEEALKMQNGESAIVEGVVSFNDRGQTIYIQDETGGIALSNKTSKIPFKDIKKGNKVKVSGTKNTFENLDQLQATKIDVVEESADLTSETVSIKDLNSGKYESKYVKVENAVVDIFVNDTKKEYKLKQDNYSLDVYFKPMPNSLDIKTGDTVNVEGTMGVYKNTIQIYGGSCTFTKVDEVAKLNINHEAIKQADINNDLKIDAEITGTEVSNVELNYKVTGAENFEKLEMTKGEGNKYSATIGKEKLNLKGLEYYISAKDKNGDSNTDTYSVRVTNGIAPEIYDMFPAENSRVKLDEFSNIKASIKSEKDIDTASVKVYLDNNDVTSNAKITKESIEYTPSNKLNIGSHVVKIDVKDSAGNLTTKEWSFRIFKDGDLKHLFGQLHAHTNISDGSGSLDEAYKWVKENKADYYAVTDHSNWFDNDTEANLGDGSKSEKWTKAHETADKYNDPGKFTAIYGYEMTWSGSTGGWGHINTFNTPGFETRTNKAMDLQNYYKTIQTQPQSISQLNHPGKTFGDFADFGFYSEGADKNVNLIEVGNGEGPIRGSGYFPSYEYYTRALDKGWHVAPTNSQDNHKGNWFTSNNARTIVIADDNSRDSIYDALREKRVYASEDTDMTIDYTVNDEVMGTSLGNVDGKLNFKINATDPTDKIKKISIIANGGVEVESKTFNDNNANWELTLDPEYSYYYVKVVQEDKDISVTSPVWVGDALNVGLSNAKVDTDMTLPGENVELNVGFFNNGEKEVKDVKFEFFKNNINADSKIGEKVVGSVASTKTENVKFNWKADKEGEYTLYAKATVKLDKGEKSFTTSAKVKIVNPDKVKKVLVDGSHYNQYVTGDYAGKYTAFKSLLTEKDGLTVINKDKITDEILKDVKILVLTNPQSTENTTAGLKASKFDDDEIKAIKRYVEKGGNVIVSTRADYKDGKGEYSNGAQMNSVLEAIGTKLRVNDDEVIDTTKNGGQEYRLYLTNYDSPNYNLLNGVENGKDEYSFYNGASVVLADGASPEGVDFLVKGFETTETKDADGDKDNVEVPKGNVNMLGVEQLSNGGKVVVSGNTFFSDFEIDGTNGDKYSNVKITNNIVNWMMPSKEIKTIKLGDIRKDSNNDGTPDLYGQKVTVEGYVTSQSEAVEPKNSFFEVVYITDETGGACVFGVSSTKLKVGQKVRITGVVDAYQGELEISLADRDSGPVSGNIESKNVQILDENIVDVKPVELSTKDSMLPSNGGKLVKVQGKVVRMDKQNLYIDDGSGESRVYVEGYIWDGINKEESLGKWDKNIEVGDNVSAIGLASWDPENGRLRVRNTGEIKFQENVTSKHWENKDLTRNRVN